MIFEYTEGSEVKVKTEGSLTKLTHSFAKNTIVKILHLLVINHRPHYQVEGVDLSGKLVRCDIIEYELKKVKNAK